jgi:hypothetical protein
MCHSPVSTPSPLQLTPTPPSPAAAIALTQAAMPGVTIASFDTTDEAIESLAQELGVKGLPQIRFFKASTRALGWAGPCTRVRRSAGGRCWPAALQSGGA